MKLIRPLFAALISIMFLTGCLAPPPVETPMPKQFYDNDDGQNKELIIFLHGRGDDLGVFEREGFFDNVSRNADFISLGSHLGYYVNGLLGERVYSEVIAPYQEKGYERFIVVGTSLGGFGALWSNNEYDELITGVVLIAPYLGRKSVIKEVQSSGSLQSWREQLSDEPSPGQQAWIWVDELALGNRNKNKPLILAYGEKDGFSRAAGLLSKNLPELQVFTNDGGHNWKTWLALWNDINASPDWQDQAREEN